MITFDQTLDSVQRILELMKSVEEVDSQIDHTRDNLADLVDMLEYAHEKDFENVEAALDYIDKVLLPRLRGINTALESGTSDPLHRLGAATDHTKRLLANLELVTGSSPDSFSP